MSDQPPFISHATNREDVVLWRALRDVTGGQFIEYGVTPSQEVATRALRERGWTGRSVQHGDDAVEALALGADDGDLHLMLLGESSDGTVPRGIDLRRLRPWVIVISSTELGAGQGPAERESAITDAGYVFCLFDGEARIYVAEEKAADLKAALSYPACARDEFTEARVERLLREHEALTTDLERWRAAAITHWADADEVRSDELDFAEKERDAALGEIRRMRDTLSWRITRPIRVLRQILSNR